MISPIVADMNVEGGYSISTRMHERSGVEATPVITSELTITQLYDLFAQKRKKYGRRRPAGR